MTTAKEQFKSDLQKHPEDLEREADSAREDLEGTVDKLMHQLSPSELLDKGISFFQNKGDNDFVRSLINRVENNPFPTVLAGVSLIWLMTASNKSSAHDTAERTRETGHQVAAGASDAMHRVKDAGRNTAESARGGLRDAREGYTQMLQDQPLLVGALAVAAGAALGALLPRTSAEDRMMGELSDRGADALKARAEEELHEAQGDTAPDSEGRHEVSADSTHSPKAPNKPAQDFSGERGTTAGTASGQAAPPPPDPASQRAGQNAGKNHPGNNY